MNSAVSLSERTSKALAWRFISTLSNFTLRFVVGVILARLLPVEAFGLLGLARIFTGFASVISTAGIAPALVQRKDLNSNHVRVGFTLSVIAGILVTAFVWLCAPLAAVVLKNDAVIPILRLISLSFLFSSFGVTARALLKKELDFRKLFWVGICSYGLGYAVVGLTLGILGYGVWALAWASVCQSLVASGVLLIIATHPLRPKLTVIEARQLLHFGVGMSLTRVVNYAARNGDYFVAGRWLGSEALGLYSRAYQLMIMPIGQFTMALTSVLFPAYAEIQDEKDRLRKAYLGCVSVIALAVFPVLTGMAVVAQELICVLFGSKWVGAVTAFQILCVAGSFRSIYTLGDAIARAKGAVYNQFHRHLLYAVTIFAACFFCRHWGIEGLAAGVVVAVLVIYFLMAQLSLKLIGCSWSEFFRAQIPGLIIATIIFLATFPARLALKTSGFPDMVVLAVTVFVAAAAFILMVRIFPKRLLGESGAWALHKMENIWRRSVRPVIVSALEQVRLRLGFGQK